ncbi:EcsC family protein [Photobacterium damselae]|uniref:EcsC family protein n=1 Tax=Photobacterium damselae TaxID=38293 RepID=UPI00165EB03C|nr:EcsC family protein [Photobacterium damselae]
MANDITESKIMQVLNWTYDKAVNGVTGLDSAVDLAQSYMKNESSLVDQANSLIRWQNTKAGTAGFLTGLGGLMTMPVSLPANITSVMYVQVRMVAAIAHMGGYDLKDDQVKTLVFTCLVGNAAKDILKDIGIVVGKKMTENAIKNISGKTITKINKIVGFRLLTKFGKTGAINLGKMIPIMGGIVGATFDSVTTNQIGNTARRLFIEQK